jgi:SAM-dependent methyltransferase
VTPFAFSTVWAPEAPIPEEADSMQTTDDAAAAARIAYNLAADRYHERFHDEMCDKPYDRALLDRLAESLAPGALVLDAGCGPCAPAGRHLRQRGARVIGIDISDRCVILAREHVRELRFAQADLARLPFSGGVFDGILAYYSLIDTPKALLAVLASELCRVLAPGGRLLVVVKAGLDEGISHDLLGIATNIWFARFTPQEIAQLLTDAGLEVELLESRAPYELEIGIERIYAVGRRVTAT